MSTTDFKYLINLIGSKIYRTETNWRKAIYCSFLTKINNKEAKQIS